MKKHLLLLYFLLAWSISFAQQEQHFFRTLDTDDGLPHNFVIDILEDRDGLMWISTPAGLSKYNGQDFTTYVPHVIDSTAKEGRLPFIWDLFEDSKSQMWLGANNGLYLFDKEKGTASLYQGFENDNIDFKNIIVVDILENNDDQLWIASNQGIVCLNFKTKSSRLYTHPSYSYSSTLQEGPQGQIWVSTFNGLFLCAPSGEMTFFPFINSNNSTHHVRKLFVDTGQRFWLATIKGLYLFDPEQKQYEQVKIKGFEDININRIVELTPGNIYLGTQNNGLLHWNSLTGEVIANYRSNFESVNGLLSNYIYAIGTDRHDNIWLGSKNGISIFRPGNNQIRLFPLPGGKRNPDNEHNRLFVDSQQRVWQSGHKLDELNYRQTIESPINKAKWLDPISGSFYRSMAEDKNGAIWYAVGEQGLFRAPPQSANFSLVTDTSAFEGNRITISFLDKHDNNCLWVNTSSSLSLYNTVTHDVSWLHPTLLDSNATEDYAFMPIQHNDGSIWFFNSKRLCSYQHITKDYSSYSLVEKVTNKKIDLGNIVSMKWLGDRLYIADSKGLFSFNLSNENFVQLEKANFTEITNFIIDNDGFIWLTNSNLLFKYNPQSKVFQTYSATKYCSNFSFDTNATLADGRLLFGTKCGLLVVDPTLEAVSSHPPKVVLSSFLVRNQPYNLSGAPEFIAQIELPYQDNFFTINYTALEYLDPENISYRYKLEGLNEDWVNAGHDHSVNFANLAPGSYTFLAEATLPDGTKSSTPLRLPIVIKPAYWQTLAFKAMIAICLLAIIFLIFRARQKAQQLAADKRLAEQNSLYKSKFLANVSHEIRTPLNAILGINSLLMESTNLDSKQQHFTESIHLSCEKLLAIINDLLDQAKIESGKFSLNPQPFELRQLIHQIERLLEHKFSEKGLILRTEVDQKIPKILIGDAIRLFQILMNLTGNALKFTEAGTVSIQITSLSQKADTYHLQFEVIDTGVGIPSEKLNDVFKSFEQLGNNQPTSYQEQGTGLGLSIAKELIELQGGQITLTSTVGQGTTFRFSMPFQVGKESVATAQSSSPHIFPSGLKVLIVDDTPINQFLTAELLKKHLPEVQTDTAANGEVALNKIINERYDLVLMDVRMPVMGGMEATQRVRSESDAYYKSLPILGLTSDAIPQQIEACRQAGMNDCLSKPVRTIELIAMIKKHL